MEELERHGEYILDNKNIKLIHGDSSRVLHFNFKDMCFRDGIKKTLKPIRYEIEKQEILYWANSTWRSFGKNWSESILKLFNNYCDNQILGDNETSNNS